MVAIRTGTVHQGFALGLEAFKSVIDEVVEQGSAIGSKYVEIADLKETDHKMNKNSFYLNKIYLLL